MERKEEGRKRRKGRKILQCLLLFLHVILTHIYFRNTRKHVKSKERKLYLYLKHIQLFFHSIKNNIY